MTDLNKHISANIYKAFTASVIGYLDELVESKTLIDDKIIDNVLNEIRDHLLSNDGIVCIDYTNEACTCFSDMFAYVIECSNKLTKAHITKLTFLFHAMELDFEQSKKTYSVPAYRTFEPKLLLELFDSNKIDNSERELLIQRTLLLSIKKGYNQRLDLNDKLFEHLTLDTKNKMLLQMVNANKNDNNNEDWTVYNFEYLTNIVCNENNHELGLFLFLNSLYTTHDKFGVHGVRYVNENREYPSTYSPYIEKIRAYMCGSIENYLKMYETAEVLGLDKSKDYWFGVLHKEIEFSNSIGIEF